MDLISRDEARHLSMQFYFTGIPCKRGHVCPRYVSSGICRRCKATRRVWKGAEIGTDEYDQGVALYERRRRAATGLGSIQSKRQRALGTARYQILRARTPPWLTSDERRELKQFGMNKQAGMVTDHRVPLLPTRCEIGGIHTIENMQYLTVKRNCVKANRVEGDLAEHVQQGRAVWSHDIDDCQGVNWQPYVGDRLGHIWLPIATALGPEPFTLADLAARGLKIPMQAPVAATHWLDCNIGLLSGGYRLVAVVRPDGVPAWRLATE